MPRCVTAKTTLALPMVLSSTKPCLMRKSKYSFRTLQLTLALYIMWVSFSGPLCASTLRMSTYISSLLRLMCFPFPCVSDDLVYSFCDCPIHVFSLFNGEILY
jgi:hypothetical protein